MDEVSFKPIGIIYSPFKRPEGTPIQPASSFGTKGEVIVYPEYQKGLKDLEGFSHIILIYYFHLVSNVKLLVKPYMDEDFHGVFATRAPARPNPIGISVVRLLKVEDNILHVENVDVVDGTPLLDIKPYVPDFDGVHESKVGWLEKHLHKLKHTRDDGRFAK